MRVFKYAVILIFTCFIVTACTKYYGYGINGVSPVHFDKSIGMDSISMPITVSGSYSNTFMKMFHQNEFSHHGALAVSGRKQMDMLNFFYGGHGYFGNYHTFNNQEVIVGKDNDVPPVKTNFDYNHQFYGGGLSAEMDVNFKYMNSNYYYGIQPNVYIEAGSFSRFRDSISAIKDTLGWIRHQYINLGNSPLGASLVFVSGAMGHADGMTYGGESSIGTCTAIPLYSKISNPTFDMIFGVKIFLKKNSLSYFGQFSGSYYSGGALTVGIAYSFW